MQIVCIEDELQHWLEALAPQRRGFSGFTRTHQHRHTHTPAHTYAHAHTHVHARARTHKCAHTHTYTNAHAQTRTHTCTHTHESPFLAGLLCRRNLHKFRNFTHATFTLQIQGNATSTFVHTNKSFHTWCTWAVSLVKYNTNIYIYIYMYIWHMLLNDEVSSKTKLYF